MSRQLAKDWEPSSLNKLNDQSRGEGSEENEEIPLAPSISSNSSDPPSRADWPADSILDDFMQFTRRVVESEDQVIIGTILPVVAAVLGRNVWVNFYGKKYPNIFNMIVLKPGLRKSTVIRLAEKLAHHLLQDSYFIPGVSSEEALFEAYLTNPERILIEDEGNTILSNWATSAPGKIVAKRFLKLYDCGRWAQSYMRQKDGKDGSPDKVIAETCTSLLIGTTLNNARFNGLEVRDGMRRRVNYYVSECMARTIYWPPSLDNDTFDELARRFYPLRDELGGEMKLSKEAMDLWVSIQDANRVNIVGTTGIDRASEAHASALAEEPSKILKRAMIFHVCRWANDRSIDWQCIDVKSLSLASQHEKYCLSASRRLDTLSERSEITNDADLILARIRTEHARRGGREENEEFEELDRTQLTSAFAHNSNRPGAMTTDRLYLKVIPSLIERGLAQTVQKAGKKEVYRFKLEPTRP